MPDTQIHPLGTVIAPGDFTIPGSAELKLKGVYASFDGSGAATSFVPLVRFISDAGSVALEAPSDATIAAGGSADASWFPRLAAASTTVAAGGVAVAAGRVDPTTPVTVPAHGTIEIPWVEVNVSDATQFSWFAGSPSILNVTNGGLILYAVTITPWVDWPLDTAGFIRFFGHSGSDDATEQGSVFGEYPEVGVFSDKATGPWPVTQMGITAPTDLNGSKTWQARIRNTTGVDWQFGTGSHFTAVRISDVVFD